MITLKYHPQVASEIKSSYVWYQKQASGLGEDLLTELEFAYQVILELPDTWPLFQKGFRRYLLSRFPFSIIYRKSGNLIFVVAVMHNSKKPYYWLSRT